MNRALQIAINPVITVESRFGWSRMKKILRARPILVSLSFPSVVCPFPFGGRYDQCFCFCRGDRWEGGGGMKRGGLREEFKNCQVQQKEQVEGVDQSIVFPFFLFDST
jgi:hypothetical protein